MVYKQASFGIFGFGRRPALLTPKTISAMLSVDRDTVVNWHTRGIKVKQKSRTVLVRLQAGKKGGRWFISPQSLRVFLVRLGHEPPPELGLD